MAKSGLERRYRHPAASSARAIELAPVQYVRGGGDIFPPGLLGAVYRIRQWLLRSDLGELDQPRQSDARDHGRALPLNPRDGQVGRRAAEHVSQQNNAVAGVAPGDACLNFGTSVA